MIPLLGSDPSTVRIAETGGLDNGNGDSDSGSVIWKAGGFVNGSSGGRGGGGVSGLFGAEVDLDADAVAIAHGSGEYRFVRVG
jgi:hypothetical protein